MERLDGVYLIEGVLPDEYRALKGRKSEIITSALEREPESDDLKRVAITFKYNPSRQMIGVFVGQGPLECLAIEVGTGYDRDLERTECKAAGYLSIYLREALENLRQRHDVWIE